MAEKIEQNLVGVAGFEVKRSSSAQLRPPPDHGSGFRLAPRSPQHPLDAAFAWFKSLIQII
jgi:hypothetical protein